MNREKKSTRLGREKNKIWGKKNTWKELGRECGV